MGARKTPSQSRERDAALAAVKNLAAAATAHEPEPREESKPAPREAPTPVAAAPAPAVASEGTSLLKGNAGMDEEMLRTRTEALVDQFLCNSDLADAVQNVVELAAPSTVDQLVSTAISHTLDRSPEARRLTGQLLRELLGRKLLALEQFTRGLHGVLEYGEDMELDIPKVWEYVAELVAPLFLDLLALQYLREATEPLRSIGRAGRLAACVLLQLAKSLVSGCSHAGHAGHQGMRDSFCSACFQGEPTVLNMWRTAGLEWSHFLKPEEDAEAFAKANVRTTFPLLLHGCLGSGQLGVTWRGGPAGRGLHPGHGGGPSQRRCPAGCQSGPRRLCHVPARDRVSAHLPGAHQGRPLGHHHRVDRGAHPRAWWCPSCRSVDSAGSRVASSASLRSPSSAKPRRRSRPSSVPW